MSIKTARKTPYDAYVQVLDEVWMAYFDMWDVEARKAGFGSYKDYSIWVKSEPDRVNEIRKKIKAAISIAEPDAR